MIIEGPLRASSLFSCALAPGRGRIKKKRKGAGRRAYNKKEKKGRRAQGLDIASQGAGKHLTCKHFEI
jgi:hypothetical protein